LYAPGAAFTGALHTISASVRLIPACSFVPQQLFPHAFFDARVVDVFIHACQRAEILNEGKGCFFTHSRDAGILSDASPIRLFTSMSWRA
jgi:hypothetical protein